MTCESKYRVGGKSQNDNRVDAFIWHLGVGITIRLKIWTLMKIENSHIVKFALF